MRKDAGKDADAGSVDATWQISSLSLRMCARQDCFVFERHQVVFYCNFSSFRHVSKSANLIGRTVFDAVRQTKKTNPRRFYAWRFSCRCAHSHWRPLFSHEALNVGEYRARNSSRCVRAFRFPPLNAALRYTAHGNEDTRQTTRVRRWGRSESGLDSDVTLQLAGMWHSV